MSLLPSHQKGVFPDFQHGSQSEANPSFSGYHLFVVYTHVHDTIWFENVLCNRGDAMIVVFVNIIGKYEQGSRFKPELKHRLCIAAHRFQPPI